MKFLWLIDRVKRIKDKGCKGIERKYLRELMTFAFFKFLDI